MPGAPFIPNMASLPAGSPTSPNSMSSYIPNVHFLRITYSVVWSWIRPTAWSNVHDATRSLSRNDALSHDDAWVDANARRRKRILNL